MADLRGSRQPARRPSGPDDPFSRGPLVPSVDIELEAGARFVWAEIWHPGRYDRGALSEKFEFTSLIQETHVRRVGRLVFRDRFHWRGSWTAAACGWHFGPHLAAGSLFVAGPLELESLRSAVPENPQLESAVLPLESGDAIVRILGSPADVTAAVVPRRSSLPAAGPIPTPRRGCSKATPSPPTIGSRPCPKSGRAMARRPRLSCDPPQRTRPSVEAALTLGLHRFAKRIKSSPPFEGGELTSLRSFAPHTLG